MDSSFKANDDAISTIKYYEFNDVEYWIYSINEENKPATYFKLEMSSKDNAPKVTDLRSPYENLPLSQDINIIDVAKDSQDAHILYLYNKFMYARSIASYSAPRLTAYMEETNKKKR